MDAQRFGVCAQLAPRPLMVGLRVHVRRADASACPRDLRFYSSWGHRLIEVVVTRGELLWTR